MVVPTWLVGCQLSAIEALAVGLKRGHLRSGRKPASARKQQGCSLVKEKVENVSAVKSTPQRKPARRCMAFLPATNVGPYSVLAQKPSAHPAGSVRRKAHGRGRPYRENRKGPHHHAPPQAVGRSAPLAPRADHSRRLPWRPSLPAPVLPRLATRREMGTPETPPRVYTWGGVIDINGVTRSRHQGKRSDGVSTRQKPHGTCTRGMDSSTIEPASRAQLPETPSCVYTR
jgi:hypothetical protein